MKQAHNHLIGALGLVILMGLSACKGAAPEGASESIAVTRQAGFKKLAAANKAIGDELKKDAPALEIVRANASLVVDLAPRIKTWFPAGSGPETGEKTEALPAIWAQSAEFDRRAQALVDASRALQTATDAGDLASIRTASAAVGATCKSCHTDFRAKK